MRRVIFTFITIVGILSVFADTVGISVEDRRSEERRRKADYAYLEARSKIYADNYASAYDLLEYAYSLDSTQGSVNIDYGFYSIMANTMSDTTD